MTTRDPADDGAPAFHTGEIAIQNVAGVAGKVAERGRRLIRDHMPEQHRAFFAGLHFINLGAVDADNRPWAILRTGAPGFVAARDETTLEIASRALPGEPPGLLLHPGAKVGVVGIELETRRRNRMNGTLIAATPELLTLQVDQSFGNCAQYIQRRQIAPKPREPVEGEPRVDVRTELNTADKALIAQADALFIATRAAVLGDDPRAGLDVNHRGGRPGFVSIEDERTLLIPDYKGNNFYNTLGNILLDDRAGLQFLDFASGDIVSLTGRAEVILKAAGQAPAADVGRSIRFTADAIRRAPGALPFRFTFIDYWPKLPEANRQSTA